MSSVLLVGSSDIDARLDLMHRLEVSFEIGAIGSQPTLHHKFLQAGFAYHTYPLSRRANPLTDVRTIYQSDLLPSAIKPHCTHYLGLFCQTLKVESCGATPGGNARSPSRPAER